MATFDTRDGRAVAGAVASVSTQAFDVVVIGGGPAGMAAALAAHKAGAHVAIVEREQHLAASCASASTGFGLSHFKQELTGPEYAQRFIDQVRATDIALFLDSMVLGIDSDEDATEGDPGTGKTAGATAVHTVTLMSPAGMLQLTGRAVVLAMGCRERTRSEIKIPGSVPPACLRRAWRSDTSISKTSSPARAPSFWARVTSGLSWRAAARSRGFRSRACTSSCRTPTACAATSRTVWTTLAFRFTYPPL